MTLSFKFIVLLFSVVFGNIFNQNLYEGDLCTISSSAANGTCRLIGLCPSALEDLEIREIWPQTCGFIRNDPIVCCVSGSAPVVTSATSTAKIVTVLTPRVTPTPIRSRVHSTAPTVNPKSGRNRAVGDRSNEKCREYGNLVYQDLGIIVPFGRNAQPRTEDCSVVQVEDIVGGTLAKAKEFPHMALVGFEDYNNVVHWDCGGSLISEKFVLSAAHCTYSTTYRRDAKYILLGELVLESTLDDANPQMILIENTISHPEYLPPSRYHDIALFELQREPTLDAHVRPACLNTNPHLTNRVGVASGWGITSNYGEMSKKMRKVTLDIFTTAECNNTYRRDARSHLAHGIHEKTQMCVGSRDEGKDTCQGDSGGPLQIINSDPYCTYNIIGVTSFGIICGRVNFPGVYTRVSAYIKWIEDIVWPIS